MAQTTTPGIDKLRTLAATSPTLTTDPKELRALVPLGARGADFLVHLELAARHDRERQVFEGLLRWRVTNTRGEGSFHSASHPGALVLVTAPNPRYSLARLQEVFLVAAAELAARAEKDPGVFSGILDPAHDAWGKLPLAA